MFTEPSQRRRYVEVCLRGAAGLALSGALVDLIVSGGCPFQPKGTVLLACAFCACPGSLRGSSH